MFGIQYGLCLQASVMLGCCAMLRNPSLLHYCFQGATVSNCIPCLQSCCVCPVVRSNQVLFLGRYSANFVCHAFGLAVFAL